MQPSTIRIVAYSEVASTASLTRALDDILFEASATTSFTSDAARAAFRDRWLGRYLAGAPEHAFLALSGKGEIAGYLVGALADPALDRHLDDLGYVQDFAALSARYPAHLHINLAPQYRSGGIGARLVEAFATHAVACHAPGMHVVTARGMRNVGFYLHNGFSELGRATWRGRTLLFLARSFDVQRR